jgi:Tfp pilus assembly protein PilW
VSPRASGFSLLELVIATALTTTVVACVFALMHPAQGAFATEPEVADMQQRLRVAVDTLTRDVSAAGAGAYIAGRRGRLIQSFAPVLPFRQGLSGAAAGTVRADTVTVIAVPATAAQTTLAADLLPGVLTLQAVAEPGCPAGTKLCGFGAGMVVAAYDDTGNVGLFAVEAVADAAAQILLTPRPADSSSTMYKAGSTLAQVRVDTYYLKSDAASQTFQLMHADGSSGADVPVVDHVVALAFDYDAEPRPPSLAAGETSYGPAPPPVGTQTTGYPAGENCVFQLDPVGGNQVPRLPPLAAGPALVPLASAQLADGPWCPDEASANRWDADLLRIRRVGVTIRVEAALAALRGPAGVLFANRGFSGAPNRWVPDQEIRVQVSPRNMNPGRP